MIVTFYSEAGEDRVRLKPDQYTEVERPVRDADKEAWPHLWSQYLREGQAMEKTVEAASVGDNMPGAGVPVEQGTKGVGAPPKRSPGRPKKVQA